MLPPQQKKPMLAARATGVTVLKASGSAEEELRETLTINSYRHLYKKEKAKELKGAGAKIDLNQDLAFDCRKTKKQKATPARTKKQDKAG
mmetsp:Transcript_29552/g.45036  ORF Transcript_29552/g.45036 Transcript_29552/m.45036 type:complete len:90 (+) Transcript_29552:725-994(+)|eukprot:CAMPEP_0170498694 /NCGR_PEP_ID=MMETSP0208-20121228/28630_1 /TAXON_ID=197538 /ORGANISM="Strombidium inclinatum, Strain S3" /LENGTH=89 /DNA_ID=CAMNT_0010775947 /DNA_START=665 /DNA_END=934 /DNA_ORIENTATION=+